MKKYCYIELAILMLLLLLIPVGSCKKSDNNNQKGQLIVFDISQQSSWDYMAVAEDGSYLMVNEVDGTPREAFFRPTNDHSGYVIILDEVGMPDKAVVNGHIILFSNFNGSNLDLAVIYPDGAIKIFRDIDVGVDIKSSGLKSEENIEDWLTALKIVGHAAGVAACAIGIATTPAGGIGLPLVYLGCGATILGLIAEVTPDETEFLGLSSTTLGLVSTVAGCVPPPTIDCVLGLIDTGIGIFTTSVGFINQNQNSVNLANGVLMGGSGDIQVTLTWNSICDLDLWVTDPFGETIKWNHPTSQSGGYLDYDNTYGYGPENIFWPKDKAPSGDYEVKVNHYNGSGPSTYSILIIANDEVLNNGKPYTGVIYPDDVIHVSDFFYGGEPRSVMVNKIVDRSFKAQKSK